MKQHILIRRLLSKQMAAEELLLEQQEKKYIVVEVPAAEFYKKYRGLVKLLRAIERAGDNGISTSKLCYKVFVSRHTFCIEQLEFAEKQGYITRDVVPVGGRGHPYTLNKITNRGKSLLKELKGLR
jgi:hypothetical protein